MNQIIQNELSVVAFEIVSYDNSILMRKLRLTFLSGVRLRLKKLFRKLFLKFRDHVTNGVGGLNGHNENRSDLSSNDHNADKLDEPHIN